MFSKGPNPGNRGRCASASGHSLKCLNTDYQGWGFLLR